MKAHSKTHEADIRIGEGIPDGQIHPSHKKLKPEMVKENPSGVDAALMRATEHES